MRTKTSNEVSHALAQSQFAGPIIFGPPIYPRDPADYPTIIRSNDKMAIVAINRQRGYLNRLLLKM